MSITKQYRRKRIKHRIRKIIHGTAEKPRLCVFRSNRQIYAQLIDDVTGHTLMAASSQPGKEAKSTTKRTKSINKIEQAEATGKTIGDKAIKAGITTVVFDRNGYLYHGRVKSLAEAARKTGLNF